jgi:uroporphyrinogen decarboxylase
MTSRDRIVQTLRFEQPDRPPHFESMFELEREAFGLSFPPRETWEGMTASQKAAAIEQCMNIYERIIERFEWDGLLVYWPWSDPDGVRAAVKRFAKKILVGGVVGEGVWAIEMVKDWTQFAVDLVERPERLHEEAERFCRVALDKIDRLLDAGADFIFMPSDVAFNAGPFISPRQYAELVTPYWARLVRRVKDRGAWAFVHTDGQIMPILDQLVSLGAHCLQSIDPMAGVDIAEVKRRTYGKLALMGNVQCNLLQDGPNEAIRKSALYCLEHTSPGGGYIYGTSNTIFPGMPLKNYEYMLEVFREFNSRTSGAPRKAPVS